MEYEPSAASRRRPIPSIVIQFFPVPAALGSRFPCGRALVRARAFRRSRQRATCHVQRSSSTHWVVLSSIPDIRVVFGATVRRMYLRLSDPSEMMNHRRPAPRAPQRPERPRRRSGSSRSCGEHCGKRCSTQVALSSVRGRVDPPIGDAEEQGDPSPTTPGNQNQLDSTSSPPSEAPFSQLHDQPDYSVGASIPTGLGFSDFIHVYVTDDEAHRTVEFQCPYIEKFGETDGTASGRHGRWTPSHRRCKRGTPRAGRRPYTGPAPATGGRPSRRSTVDATATVGSSGGRR